MPELRLQHDTRYDYGAPVAQAEHMALLRPMEDEHQQVVAHECRIEPAPSHQRVQVDAEGRHRLFFSHHRAHLHMAVQARSQVRLRARFLQLDITQAPTWSAVADALRYRAGQAQPPEVAFAQPSPRVPRLSELQAYAQASVHPEQTLPHALLALMHRVHADFTFAPASTQVDTPLATAFAQRRGVCQDFAHVLIGLIRALGLPARYISGYLLTHPPPGEARLVGADASHAWVQAWCPGTVGVPGQWLDLDPTNDCIPTEGHIRLGAGRDYDEVAPLRGVIRGGGQHRLTVAVDVGPVFANHNAQEAP
jgi:transglutaminase-like putative cysteine protease